MTGRAAADDAWSAFFFACVSPGLRARPGSPLPIYRWFGVVRGDRCCDSPVVAIAVVVIVVVVFVVCFVVVVVVVVVFVLFSRCGCRGVCGRSAMFLAVVAAVVWRQQHPSPLAFRDRELCLNCEHDAVVASRADTADLDCLLRAGRCSSCRVSRWAASWRGSSTQVQIGSIFFHRTGVPSLLWGSYFLGRCFIYLQNWIDLVPPHAPQLL